MKKVIYGVELDFTDEDVRITPNGDAYIVLDGDPYSERAYYDHEIRCDELACTVRFQGTEIEVSNFGELDITCEAQVLYDTGEVHSYTGWGACEDTVYIESDVNTDWWGDWCDQPEYQQAIVDAVNNAYSEVMSHIRRALESKEKVTA